MSGSWAEALRKPLTLQSGARSALRRSLLLALALCAALAFGAPAVFGATPSTPYDLVQTKAPSPQPTGRFGERHAAAEDLNGDGVNDYFIGANSQDVRGTTNAGRVFLMSGRTREVLWTRTSPELQENADFGFFISNLRDVNGDGWDDLAVGTDSQHTTAAGASCTPPAAGCNENQGKAWVFNGRTGALLYAVNNPNPQADGRFGSRIGRAGDLNGDGVAESIMGASNNDLPAGCGQTGGAPLPAGCRRNQGQAFIFDGRTGALFRELNLPASDRQPAPCSSSCGGFGLSVQGPGDVNGDGVTDQLVNASSLSYRADGTVCVPATPGCLAGVGSMYLFSGAGGAVLARIDDPVPEAGATFGFQDAAPLSPGDVNGDGRADLYGNGFSQDGPAGLPEVSQGRMWVFDGRATVENPAEHGVVLYEPKDPTPTVGGQCCFSLDKTDYNKDGRPDLYVGASPHHAGGVQSGGTYVFEGRSGALLRAFELPPALAQAGGSFANLGSNLGWSVAAPGDLNGDGEPDYVAGAPFQDSQDNLEEGSSFVFLSRVPGAAGPPSTGGPAPFAGCPTLTANVIRGSAAGGRITGTVRGDRIFGGTGNDVVDGLAGDDCIDLGPGTDSGQGGLGNDLMLGGLGDDRMAGSSGNDRIRGGGSSDRINGGFGNDVLHGQAGRDRVNGSRGRDRINGGSSSDVISAGSSADRVAGDQGHDRINGNSGNDFIRGNSGNDRLAGSTGRDRIAGDSGNDRVNSRDGRRDQVSCGRGRDTVVADRFDRISRSCERVSRRG